MTDYIDRFRKALEEGGKLSHENAVFLLEQIEYAREALDDANKRTQSLIDQLNQERERRSNAEAELRRWTGGHHGDT